MDWIAIGWAALAGALGGLLGALLGGLAPARFRAVIAAGMAILAVAGARAVGPEPVLEALGLHSILETRAQADHEAFESSLSGLPDNLRETFDVIRRVDPAFYDQLITDVLRAARDGGEAAAFARSHEIFAVETSRRLTLANDVVIKQSMTHLVSQLSTLIGHDNDNCLTMASGRVPSEVPDFPPEFFDGAAEYFELLFSSEPEAGEVMDAEQATQLIAAAIGDLYQRHDPALVQATFSYFTEAGSAAPPGGCAIFVDYLQVLFSGSPEEAGPLWRALNASG